MGELVSAWVDWWNGSSVSDHPLWGHDVLFWGRVGKGLQFLAGLAVVLDLVSPDRLRTRGTAARRELRLRTARWRRQRTARRLEWIRVGLVDSLDFSKTWPTEKKEWVARFDPDTAKRLPGFAEEELWTWIRETRAAMNPDNWTVKTYPTTGRGEQVLDAHDQAVVDERIREFLRAQLSPYSFAAWSTFGSHIDRQRNRTVTFWMALGLGVVAVPVIIDAVLFDVDPSSPITLLPALVSVTLLMIGIFSQIGIGDLFAARLLRLPRFAFYTATASILDSARPGHKLRWLAFVLFIIGFHFDLLAS